jgi:hypothetical protein
MENEFTIKVAILTRDKLQSNPKNLQLGVSFGNDLVT